MHKSGRKTPIIIIELDIECNEVNFLLLKYVAAYISAFTALFIHISAHVISTKNYSLANLIKHLTVGMAGSGFGVVKLLYCATASVS